MFLIILFYYCSLAQVITDDIVLINKNLEELKFVIEEWLTDDWFGNEH